MLSLEQLVYFASNYSEEAQKALVDSNHPVRWYPFSVAGINITSFVNDLIKERVLDHLLYELSGNEVKKGLEVLHRFYCALFVRFNKLWIDKEPKDAMAFPMIFKTFRDSIRGEALKQTFQY